MLSSANYEIWFISYTSAIAKIHKEKLEELLQLNTSAHELLKKQQSGNNQSLISAMSTMRIENQNNNFTNNNMDYKNKFIADLTVKVVEIKKNTVIEIDKILDHVKTNILYNKNNGNNAFHKNIHRCIDTCKDSIDTAIVELLTVVVTKF